MEQINQENQSILDNDQYKFNDLKNKVLDNISNLRKNIEEKFPSHPDIDENISGIKLRIGKINNNKHLFILEFLNNQISDLNILLSKINMDADPVEIKGDFHLLKYRILDLYDFCKNYIDFSDKILKEMVQKLMLTHRDLEYEIEKFGKLNDVLKNHKTYEIYKQSECLNDGIYKKYIKRSVLFAIGGFILSIVISLIFTQCFFEKNMCFKI